MKETKYPIYLKLEAMNTWYHILNDHSFLEIKSLADYYFISEFSDDILPMRNHISDLILGDGVEIISEFKFRSEIDELKSTKQEKKF